MWWQDFPGSSYMFWLLLLWLLSVVVLVWYSDCQVATTTTRNYAEVEWRWQCVWWWWWSWWLPTPLTNTFDRSYQRYQEVTFDESYFIPMKHEMRDVYELNHNKIWFVWRVPLHNKQMCILRLYVNPLWQFTILDTVDERRYTTIPRLYPV